MTSTPTNPEGNRNARELQGATALLKADHDRINALFHDYEQASSTAQKRNIVSSICMELMVHTQLEEEIFYPAVRGVLEDRTLVPEAIVEHAVVKALIAEIDGVDPDGEFFDAKVKVMSEYVKHHVNEEQSGIFPGAEAADLDMIELGIQLVLRRAELISLRKGQSGWRQDI